VVVWHWSGFIERPQSVKLILECSVFFKRWIFVIPTTGNATAAPGAVSGPRLNPLEAGSGSACALRSTRVGVKARLPGQAVATPQVQPTVVVDRSG
jgi:hypothetical protein